MSLNFVCFLWGKQSGGAAPLLSNSQPARLACVAALNSCIALWAFGSLMYANFVNASFGQEVPHFLLCVGALNLFAAYRFARMALVDHGSDEEWSNMLIVAFIISAMQYASMVWGGWLSYRMWVSKVMVGTRMYYYFMASGWMYNSIFAICLLNALCIVVTTYVILRNILLDLHIQMCRHTYIT